MPTKLPENMKAALEEERRALEMRMEVVGDEDLRYGDYARRVKEVDAQLKPSRSKRSERRPDDTGKETREG